MGVRDDRLNECQDILDYRFSDRKLLVTALTHASVASDLRHHNERLEFLGDAVLALVVCQHVYTRFERSAEGELTQIKSDVVSARTLAHACRALGLERFLKVGRGLSKGRHLSRRVLANVFEAVLGAIYLDGGLEPARRFVLMSLDDEIRRVLSREHEMNYKSLLQNLVQSELQIMPAYRVHAEFGPDHEKEFEVVALVDGRERGRGRGRSKKAAQQGAAKAAYESLTDRSGEAPTDRPDEGKAEPAPLPDERAPLLRSLGSALRRLIHGSHRTDDA